MKRFVFPGSFDPMTLGHKDIIERALPMCDELIIGVGQNSEKNYLFSLDERMKFILETHNKEPKIKVLSFQGLTINFCKDVNATAIVRGLRNPADFSYISSSIVREIIFHKGDYSSLVPEAVKNSR